MIAKVGIDTAEIVPFKVSLNSWGVYGRFIGASFLFSFHGAFSLRRFLPLFGGLNLRVPPDSAFPYSTAELSLPKVIFSLIMMAHKK